MHLVHNMHENSLLAYEIEKHKLTGRRANVFAFIYQYGKLTDRQVMNGMGFADMNSVRPRITELINLGLLFESGSVTCPTTNKTVRQVTVPHPAQAELF